MGNLTEATLNGVTTTAAFDATGTRVQVDGIDQLWDRTGHGTLISTSTGENYLHAPGMGVLRDDTDWLLRDAIGSVRHITNTTGDVTASTAFTAFGEPRATGSSVFGFAGEQTDPNSLIHLRARGYNPAQGTFTSYDPQQPGGPNTAGWNHYTYAANNPTTWSDPTGQTAITKTGVVVVTVPLQVALYVQLGKGIYDVLSWLLPWLWDQIKNPPFGDWPFAGNYGDGDGDDGSDWIEQGTGTVTVDNPRDDDVEVQPQTEGGNSGNRDGGDDCNVRVRDFVADQDELLEYAERAAGGSLDALEEKKPGWFQGVRPDGVLVRIEWEPVGHATTNEGPHVTVRVLKDVEAGVKGGWKVESKAFIEGQEAWGWNYCE